MNPMLFADNADHVTIGTYLDIVTQQVENGDDTYQDLIDRIILTTADVSASEGRTLSEVDSNIFYIVNELYKTNAAFFKPIHEITQGTRSSLRLFLTTLAEVERTKIA